MKIYFIRHGQTDWNKQGKMQGSTDIALNETGLEQAANVASSLVSNNAEFKKIFSSPLSRASKTAEIIGQKLDLGVEHLEELKEFYFGEWEGAYSQDLKDNDLSGFNNWLENAFLITPPGGESLKDVQDRLKVFLGKSGLLEFKTDIAVVAHQGTLVALKALITGANTADLLLRYKQANNEYDVMDLDDLELERFEI